MHMKELFFTIIMLMKACGPLSAQTTAAPPQPDPPGILQRLAEKARAAKAKVQGFGEQALGFAGAYYEDHIQPVTDRYFGWAFSVKSSVLENIQTTMDNYNPLKATTPADQLPVN
ncbi:apolipoprotein C-IV [Labrus mixtus]|uniref:apolipoprotein C-IV n=1 Tax=Labrus mixtus TaxID=508554 RepID=UPI0029C0A98A|nr:apolipoprotein C-IV [Labrus mixtus]